MEIPTLAFALFGGTRPEGELPAESGTSVDAPAWRSLLAGLLVPDEARALERNLADGTPPPTDETSAPDAQPATEPATEPVAETEGGAPAPPVPVESQPGVVPAAAPASRPVPTEPPDGIAIQGTEGSDGPSAARVRTTPGPGPFAPEPPDAPAADPAHPSDRPRTAVPAPQPEAEPAGPTSPRLDRPLRSGEPAPVVTTPSREAETPAGGPKAEGAPDRPDRTVETGGRELPPPEARPFDREPPPSRTPVTHARPGPAAEPVQTPTGRQPTPDAPPVSERPAPPVEARPSISSRTDDEIPRVPRIDPPPREAPDAARRVHPRPSPAEDPPVRDATERALPDPKRTAPIVLRELVADARRRLERAGRLSASRFTPRAESAHRDRADHVIDRSGPKSTGEPAASPQRPQPAATEQGTVARDASVPAAVTPPRAAHRGPDPSEPPAPAVTIRGTAAEGSVPGASRPTGPPVDLHALARAIVARARPLPDGGSVQLRFALHPEELGRLRVRLESSGEQLRIELFASSRAALETLNAELPRLALQLRDAGVREPQLDLQLDPQGEESSSWESARERREANRRRERHGSAAGAAAHADVTTRPPHRTEGAGALDVIA